MDQTMQERTALARKKQTTVVRSLGDVATRRLSSSLTSLVTLTQSAEVGGAGRIRLTSETQDGGVHGLRGQPEVDRLGTRNKKQRNGKQRALLFNKMSSSLKARPVAGVSPGQMRKQMSLDGRSRNRAVPGFEATEGAMEWTEHGGGMAGGRGGYGEGRGGRSGGVREGGSRLGSTGTVDEEVAMEGEGGIFGGKGAVLGRIGEDRGHGEGRGEEGGGGQFGGGRGGISGGREVAFSGVFGGAGGGLGSESGEGNNANLWKRSDSLYSPPVSPVPWLRDWPSSVHQGKTPLGETRSRKNGARSEETDSLKAFDAVSKSLQLAPQRIGIRRTSSLGRIPDDLEEEQEEEGTEQQRETQVGMDQRDIKRSAAPYLNARRSRRQAICDMSMASSSGHPSSVISVLADDIAYESDDIDERKPGFLGVPTPVARRKKSSADLGVFYPGDLLSQAPPRRSDRPLFTRNTIANFANTKAYQVSTASLISELDKKAKSSFSLLKLIDKKSNRSKEVVASDLSEVLRHMTRSKMPETQLERFKRAQWTDLVSAEDRSQLEDLSKAERSRRSAAWELFTSECVFLIDHLLVLKYCFAEPLKQLQVEGHLMFVELQNLFGNLEEICSVTLRFCGEFSRMLLEDIHLRGNFCRTEVLIDGLKQLSFLSRDGEVYHDYCLNYSKAMTYLELLRRNSDFVEFEKWCEQDRRCNRLLLTDLLISPMQHCTKVPLLLNSICRYTETAPERKLIMESLEKLESSLRDLDDKMKWLKSFERIQEIQQQIVWPPVTEFEPRIFIPECLRSLLNRQPCEGILSNPNRQLLHEGPVQLLEALTKQLEMYLFLFDDILLLAKIKKLPKKRAGSDSNPYTSTNQWTDGAALVVHRQPIALDRVKVHDLQPTSGEAQGPGSCPRNAFVVVQFTRFQQIVSVYTLQAPTSEAKLAWLNVLRASKESFRKSLDSSSQPTTITSHPRLPSNATSNNDNKKDNEYNHNEDNNDDNDDKDDDNDKEDNYNDRMSDSSADDIRSIATTTTTTSSLSSLPVVCCTRSSLCRRHHHHHLSSHNHLYSAMRRPRSERRQPATPSSVTSGSFDVFEDEDIVVQPSRSEDELERVTEDEAVSDTSIGEQGLERDDWMTEGESFTASGEPVGIPDIVLDLDQGQGSEGLPVIERTDQTSTYSPADTIYV